MVLYRTKCWFTRSSFTATDQMDGIGKGYDSTNLRLVSATVTAV